MLAPAHLRPETTIRGLPLHMHRDPLFVSQSSDRVMVRRGSSPVVHKHAVQWHLEVNTRVP